MADEETKPKRKAKDNPWYRLMTVHREPSWSGDEIALENRETWNRWMASRISSDLRAALLEKGWSSEELTPFSEDERRSIEAQVGSSLEADEIDFSNTEFETPLYAAGLIFPRVAFVSAAFHGVADFVSATFSGSADFDSAAFSDDGAYFGSATFSGVADFGSATFSGDAYFRNATFSRVANFDSATFSDNAYFRSAIFSGDAVFISVAFSRVADFGSATFSDTAYFESATFSDVADFMNAEMKGQTTFDDVKFSEPPRCFNTELHEGTTWDNVEWPVPPGNAKRALDFAHAYERLKQEMYKLNKHGDELDFFALEQQCRRVVKGFWAGLPMAIYGFVSDYGRDYVRPFLLLVQTVLVGAIPLLATPMRVGHSDFFRWNSAAEAIGISFANTFSILGRPLIETDVLLGLPNWLKAVATLQTIFGIALLFFFGLRNTFRMK